MSFLTPTAFFLATLLPLIIAMYLLKLRRQERQVSSIYLWKRLVRDLEANAPWQRLRINLLLLLQLLILTALILALARPYTEEQQLASGTAIVIIDNSASMGASDVTPTRLQSAKQHAHQIIDDLPTETLFTLIVASERPQILLSASSDRIAAHQSIDRIQLSYNSSDLSRALQLASAISTHQPDSRITILSDGGTNLSEKTSLNVPFDFIAIGNGSNNQALNSLELSLTPAGENLSAFVQVVNYSSKMTNRRLVIYTDGKLFDAQDLDLAPGEVLSLVIQRIPSIVKIVEAQLASNSNFPDYLASDDYALAINRAVEVKKITLVSPGNRFLETAINLLPSVETQIFSPETKIPNDSDLLILDAGVSIHDPIENTNLLYIAPSIQNSEFITITGILTNPIPVEVDVNDPLLDFVSLKEINILDAFQMSTPIWARPVIIAYDPNHQIQDSPPLLYVGERDGQRVGVLAFDLRHSDLPLQISFPLLISNLIGWLVPDSESNVPTQVTPGQTLTLTPPLDASNAAVIIRRPDGNQIRLEPDEGKVIFTDTELLGLYQIWWENQPEEILQFAINLFSPQESSIEVIPTLELSYIPLEENDQTQKFGKREWWRWGAILGFCLLMAEWLIYKRSNLTVILEYLKGSFQRFWGTTGKRFS